MAIHSPGRGLEEIEIRSIQFEVTWQITDTRKVEDYKPRITEG